MLQHKCVFVRTLFSGSKVHWNADYTQYAGSQYYVMRSVVSVDRVELFL